MGNESLRAAMLNQEQPLEKIILTQELERRRWALEIHDGITQSLANICYRLQAYRKLLLKDPEKAQQELDEIEGLVMEAIAESRGIIDELRPSILDDLGLIPAIQKYVDRVKKEDNLTVNLVLKKPIPMLSYEVETALYRIIQEALANVRKHARATTVKVEIAPQDNQLVARITDDGCGFDVETVDIEGDNWGLTGMRERAELIGGSLRIESTLGKGTVVYLEVPISP